MAEPRNFGRSIALLGAGLHATATGTTVSTTPVFDISGYSGVAALLSCSVTATGNFLVCRGGSASGSLSDLAGSALAAQTTMLMLEIRQPQNARFVDFQFRQSSASGQHGRIYVFGLGAGALPTTNSSLLSYKFVNQPVTGTATSS